MSSEPTRTWPRRRLSTLTGIASTVLVVSLVAVITRCGQPPPLTGDGSRSAGRDDPGGWGWGDGEGVEGTGSQD